MRSDATIVDARLQDAIAAIERRLRPAAILIYGSAAAGRLRPDSDVDIGLLCGDPPPEPFDLALLRTDAAALLGRDVDLVILDTASPILAMEVLRQHRVVVNHRPEVLERFVVKTLGAYFDLKRARQPIEEAVLRQSAHA